ncbi:hypothetical protein GCM10010269_56820 [Streptomyces humidus]|uniref:Histidine kinase/HSP90-like ATPase domain-containing protein n=1 Tax=Streptomyces humidus TaxID=52259 RepID=A0A918L5U3_9ACTN|nr:ATP-binding protein [Streptomyces humidus]GGS10327.1 hypothetical protein GCM10010269_56820 [Streptomyces humidus]
MTGTLALAASTAVAAGPARDAYVCPVPHTPEAVALVRRRVAALLTDWELPATTLDSVVLVVSELATNAVVHALPPAELRISYGRRLRVELCDSGPAEVYGLGLQDDEHGRGCDIVIALATECGAYREGPRSVRWAEFDAPAARPLPY